MGRRYINWLYLLLVFLPSDKFITSGEIRKKFFEIKAGTLNAKLRKLHQEGLIEVREQEMERAGDDKHAYKLSKEGNRELNKLKAKIMKILEPDIKAIIKQKSEDIAKIEEKIDEETITTFLMEFYEEGREIVNEDQLDELQQILTRLLKSYL